MTAISYEFHAPGDSERTTGVLEIIRERVESLNGLRVLDLACRTGAFSRAFADAGAEVLGIEGKSSNFDRIPETPNTSYVLDDVRNLSLEKYGHFDITLCLGILYHLEAQDAINLLRSIKEVTRRYAVIDTHIGSANTVVTVGTQRYAGYMYNEGEAGPWSALGNQFSFWFTTESLKQACRDTGWANVEELPGIRWPGEPQGRYWLVLS